MVQGNFHYVCINARCYAANAMAHLRPQYFLRRFKANGQAFFNPLIQQAIRAAGASPQDALLDLMLHPTVKLFVRVQELFVSQVA